MPAARQGRPTCKEENLMSTPHRVPGKGGRKPPDYTQPRLWADDYYRSSGLPPLAPRVDYCSKVPSWPMYLNDTLGDCTIAGAAHAMGAWSEYLTGNEMTLSNEQILAAYEACSGYVPGEANTDNGCLMSDVLAYWQRTGIGGQQIQAYAQLRDTREIDLNQALQLFGTVYIGVNLPDSAETQFSAGKPWSYVKGSAMAGGHCIVLQRFAVNSDGDYTVITWGATQAMTLGFARTYIEEAWAVLSPQWLEANGSNLSGLDVAQLTADMQALSQKTAVPVG
jgi:hypothetical protein